MSIAALRQGQRKNETKEVVSRVCVNHGKVESLCGTMRGEGRKKQKRGSSHENAQDDEEVEFHVRCCAGS